MQDVVCFWLLICLDVLGREAVAAEGSKPVLKAALKA